MRWVPECCSAFTWALTQLAPPPLPRHAGVSEALSPSFTAPRPLRLQLCGTEGTQGLWLWVSGHDLPRAKLRAWVLALSRALLMGQCCALCSVRCVGFCPGTTGTTGSESISPHSSFSWEAAQARPENVTCCPAGSRERIKGET